VSGHSRPALVHFDVKVVDSGDLPLANFPHYGQGLFLAEAVQCLSAFCASPRFAGLVLTRGNPSCDPYGDALERYLSGLVTALAGVGEKARLTERTSWLRSSSWQPARGRVASVSRRAEAFAAGSRHSGELVEIPQ
jgi:hypothetical protein